YVVAAAKDGSLQPASGANVNGAMVSALARPYPQLVSGTPSGWSFDPGTKAFSLRYSPQRANGSGSFPAGSETDIAVPAVEYSGGYQATVVGGTVVSNANAPVLQVRSVAGAASVTVSIAPGAGAVAQSNSTCPPDATSAGGVAGVPTQTSQTGMSRVTACG